MRFKDAIKYYYNHFGLIEMIRLVVIPRVCGRLMGGGNTLYKRNLDWFVRTNFIEIIDRYRNEPLYQNTGEVISENVFTFWWQGFDELPEVVKLCNDSLINNLNGLNVVMIDKNNITKYIEIPDYIYQRVQNGEMSLSHFSDIVRMSLLIKYGGMWIDSCLFVLKPLRISNELTMCRFPINTSLCDGKWCFGQISVSPGHKLMRYMYDCLTEYWRRFNAPIDYLMFDAFMMTAYKEFDDIKSEIDKFEITSPDLHKSRYLFDQPAEDAVFKNFISDNQFLSLTWRINYPDNVDGSPTYYHKLKEYLYSEKTNGNN